MLGKSPGNQNLLVLMSCCKESSAILKPPYHLHSRLLYSFSEQRNTHKLSLSGLPETQLLSHECTPKRWCNKVLRHAQHVVGIWGNIHPLSLINLNFSPPVDLGDQSRVTYSQRWIGSYLVILLDGRRYACIQNIRTGSKMIDSDLLQGSGTFLSGGVERIFLSPDDFDAKKARHLRDVCIIFNE